MCVCVCRVNKLITVRPPKSRYLGEIGDLVVGRVTEVGSKRWKIDIRGVKVCMSHIQMLRTTPVGCMRCALERGGACMCV